MRQWNNYEALASDHLAQRDAAQQDATEAWRQFHVEKAKDGDVWKDRALAAQQDAKEARALAYEECAKVAAGFWITSDQDRTRVLCTDLAADLRARIEAMLEKKL